MYENDASQIISAPFLISSLVFSIIAERSSEPSSFKVVTSTNSPNRFFARSVSKYEPLRALDGGFDGLDFYRVIAKKAYNALKKGGMLALEIGYNQRESVKALLSDFSDVSLYKDYGNNDRVIIAIK